MAIAQINCTVGDLAGNAARITEYAQRAQQSGATLLLTPELALTGYPPEDLLLRDDFYRACDLALAKLAQELPDMTVVVGHPARVGDEHFNAASVLQDGRITATYFKTQAPTTACSTSVRYFVPGDQPLVFEHHGIRPGC